MMSRTASFRAVVAGLAIALAGAFAVTAYAHGGPGGRHAAPGVSMFGGGRMLERALDDVNASDEQRSRIREIMRAAFTDLREQRDARRALRQQGMDLFTQPTVDANAVEALRQQMLAQHDQASRRMTQAMLDASQVLTPEQRQQLGERMQARREMMQRHWRERRALQGEQRGR